MSECLVCNKEFDGEICPRCNFEEIFIPSSADIESSMKRLEPKINEWRNKFYGSITAGVMICRWKDEKGNVVLDKKEKLPLGTLSDFVNKEIWSDQKFARIPDQKDIEINCYFTVNDETCEHTVTVPNLTSAEFQFIGITADAENFRIMLKNESNETTKSNLIPIFSD